jgi:NAD(P)-dependent dehydrogenase (short-subunit alcohol dehydrogenase family)
MKTWFITGASRGFGAKVAAIALARGDRVVATARNPEDVARRLDDHPSLLALALDVTNEAQAREAAAAAVARFGRIDVLLNNAGYGLMGAVEEASADEVEGVYRTNVFGLLNVTRAVLPYMHAGARAACSTSRPSAVIAARPASASTRRPSSRSRVSPKRSTPSSRRWACT